VEPSVDSEFAIVVRISRFAMPTEIKYNANVTMSDNKVAWRICHKDMQSVDGISFVTIQPSSYSFVRVVSAGSLFARSINGTLANSEAILKLKKLRNEAQRGSNSGGCKLFSTAMVPESQSRRAFINNFKTSRSEAVVVRGGARSIVSVTVPSAIDEPALEVQMLSAVNEADNLIVQLEAVAIEHILMFIRHASDLSQVEVSRPYGQSGKRGCYVRKTKYGDMHEYERLANGKVRRVRGEERNDADEMASADDQERSIADELASGDDELAPADEA
jgi:hypothetical protein